MITKPQNFEELLNLWESPKALSDDIAIPYVSAQMMKFRSSVAVRHWPAIIEAARRRGVPLTMDDLVRMKVAA